MVSVREEQVFMSHKTAKNLNPERLGFQMLNLTKQRFGSEPTNRHQFSDLVANVLVIKVTVYSHHTYHTWGRVWGQNGCAKIVWKEISWRNQQFHLHFRFLLMNSWSSPIIKAVSKGQNLKIIWHTYSFFGHASLWSSIFLLASRTVA